MSILDAISKEKQRVGEALAHVDAQREKLTTHFGELEATQRVLARYSQARRQEKRPQPERRAWQQIRRFSVINAVHVTTTTFGARGAPVVVDRE